MNKLPVDFSEILTKLCKTTTAFVITITVSSFAIIGDRNILHLLPNIPKVFSMLRLARLSLIIQLNSYKKIIYIKNKKGH